MLEVVVFSGTSILDIETVSIHHTSISFCITIIPTQVVDHFEGGVGDTAQVDAAKAFLINTPDCKLERFSKDSFREPHTHIATNIRDKICELKVSSKKRNTIGQSWSTSPLCMT